MLTTILIMIFLLAITIVAFRQFLAWSAIPLDDWEEDPLDDGRCPNCGDVHDIEDWCPAS